LFSQFVRPKGLTPKQLPNGPGITGDGLHIRAIEAKHRVWRTPNYVIDVVCGSWRKFSSRHQKHGRGSLSNSYSDFLRGIFDIQLSRVLALNLPARVDRRKGNGHTVDFLCVCSPVAPPNLLKPKPQ
jgi:hypothetical protein